MRMVIVIALILAAVVGAYVLNFRENKGGAAKRVLTTHENKVKKVYTKAEIACHNTRTDCWIIVKDKVYDVSSYVEEHPGGDAILVHAGDDSTEGFFGPQHATRVFDMVYEFYIGDLKQ